MAKKRTKLDRAVERTAEILTAHFATLPVAEAKAMRREIHELATKPSRVSGRGKALQSRKNADPRLLSRAAAKSA